jgi:hypothetical protein
MAHSMSALGIDTGCLRRWNAASSWGLYFSTRQLMGA